MRRPAEPERRDGPYEVRFRAAFNTRERLPDGAKDEESRIASPENAANGVYWANSRWSRRPYRIATP